MSAGPTLRDLRDRPMDLLLELERRGRAATAAPGAPTASDVEWVGVAVRIGGEMYLLAREEVREVLGVPSPLTRVPGAKPWILGIANVRGALLPVIDLRQFLGGGVTPTARGARVVVAKHRDVPAGLLVDEVLGFRRFAENDFRGESPASAVVSGRFVAGTFAQRDNQGEHQWPVFSLRRLLEDPGFGAGAA
jgi:twitching motility protein PilI